MHPNNVAYAAHGSAHACTPASAPYHAAVDAGLDPEPPATGSPYCWGVNTADKLHAAFVMPALMAVAEQLGREGRLPRGATHADPLKLFKVGAFDGGMALMQVRVGGDGVFGRFGCSRHCFLSKQESALVCVLLKTLPTDTDSQINTTDPPPPRQRREQSGSGSGSGGGGGAVGDKRRRAEDECVGYVLIQEKAIFYFDKQLGFSIGRSLAEGKRNVREYVRFYTKEVRCWLLVCCWVGGGGGIPEILLKPNAP
jgi:hypothetical protein